MAEFTHAYDHLDVEELRGRGSIKWTMHGPDVLAAWVAEMDFPTAPAVRAAMREAVDRDFVGYLPPDEATGLQQACADWLAAGCGLRVDPERIRLLPDVLRGVELAIEVFSRPGSPVVLPTPAYPPFFQVGPVTGRRLVEVPMAADPSGRPTLDLDRIERALHDGAGTVILCNPYNPLGVGFGRDELVALAEVVDRYGARVVSDEIHWPLTYPGSRHVPYATVSAAAAAHSVTLVSASKAWNLPGLKCAEIVLTGEDDLATWRELSLLRTHGASTIGVAASRAAFTEGGPWLADTLAYLDGNRRLLADLLAAQLPQVGYRVPDATYLAWLDCRALGLDDPSEHFLHKARVAVNDGATFGEPGRGFVRLNFATSRALLTQVVEALATAVPAG